MKVRLCCFGKYAKRIPVSYEVYRKLVAHDCAFVDVKAADVVLVGHWHDIELLVTQLQPRVNNPRIVLFSEEPFWDTLHCPDYQSGQIRYTAKNGKELLIDILNHSTSGLYEFSKIPYFVTTEDKYFARYNYFFARNVKKEASEWLRSWQTAQHKNAFVFEKRTNQKFSFKHDNDVRGLCAFRSDLGEHFFSKERSLVIGQGWNTSEPRQSIADWHLDKLERLDSEAMLVSAIENTHYQYYVTEKIYDSFAVGGIPLVYFAENHHVWRSISPESVVNLYDLDQCSSVELLESFQPAAYLAESYREMQSRLHGFYKDLRNLLQERALFAEKFVKYLRGGI